MYARLGYEAPEQRAYVSIRQRGFVLRHSLLKRVLDAFPNQIREGRKNGRFRPMLRYRKTGLLISVLFARCCESSAGRSWIIEAPRSERKHTTLLAFLNARGDAIDALRLFLNVPRKDRHVRVREDDGWFGSGVPLHDISELFEAITALRSRRT